MKPQQTLCSLACCLAFFSVSAQKATVYTTTENSPWQKSEMRLQSKPAVTPWLEINGSENGTALKAWGTTFNELDWDALQMLTPPVQQEIMHNLFAPDGDLKFTRGRISMNCNDYGRSWYSCDEVPGDFELRYFNIDRDKRGIIPLIRAAQNQNPELTFWISPWSPPSWMKINHDYPVVSSKHNNADQKQDYLLFGSTDDIDEDEMKFFGERKSQFPRKLATQDYFIQDPRYLKAYANYFCRFIDEYKEQGIPIDMVIYQNEAYSYTPYPGCPWTAEGTIRFNRDYLAPALREKHPEVKLYIGTFNTNRLDHVQKIMADEGLRQSIDGVAFQWEGREILPEIRKQYPDFHYICSESECGNGSMDWKAGEHTFFLIADNMGNGTDEWFNWNFLLPDNGISPWGWTQNALIQVDSKQRTIRYTPEYFAVKHFTNLVPPGSVMTGYTPRTDSRNAPAIVYRTPENAHIVIAGNFENEARPFTVRIAGRYLNATLSPHSFTTFVIK